MESGDAGEGQRGLVCGCEELGGRGVRLVGMRVGCGREGREVRGREDCGSVGGNKLCV